MPNSNNEIQIIIPSFKDRRIAHTIRSIRAFDVDEDVGICVVDGSQDDQFVAYCQALLGPRDQIVSEPDQGIFDALNKGLEITSAPIVGWLGSDDMFANGFSSRSVKARFEAAADIVVFSTAYHRNGMITRTLRSSVAKPCCQYFGLHNAHFSTFISRPIADNNRFDLSVAKISDIDYFLRVFALKPVTIRVDAISTLMAEGGHASGSLSGILQSFADRFSVFRARRGVISALLAPVINAGWKLYLLIEARINQTPVEKISFKEPDQL